MRTPIDSSFLSPLITTAIFGALVLSAGTASAAAPSGDPPRVIVSFGDLNLSSPDGAAKLYGRIASAADAVCLYYEVDTSNLLVQDRVRACVHKVIADAVTKVGRPGLLAIYNAKNHRRAPLIVANARSR